MKQADEERRTIVVDIRRELEGLVDRAIDDLTASGAVDEANGDVLDGLIDQTVAQWKVAAARTYLAEDKELRLSLERLDKSCVSAVGAVASLEATTKAVARRIRELRALLVSSAVPITDDADQIIDVEQLRAFVRAERAHWEAAEAAAVDAGRHAIRRHLSRRAKIGSGAQIAGVRDSARRRFDATKGDLHEAQNTLALAHAELDAALAELRGPRADVDADNPVEGARA